MQNLSISARLTALCMGILLIIAVIIGVFGATGIKKLGANTGEAFSVWSKEQIESARKSLEEYHKIRLLDLVNTATSHLEELNHQVESGKISLRQAEEEAKRRIEIMRYDQGKGYFWINSDNPDHIVMIMHPISPSLNGEIVSQFRKEGKLIYAEGSETPMFQEFVRVTRESPSGGGFVRYLWPNPLNLQEWLPKMSYVQRFEPWGWIIGSGVYIDDIDRRALAMQAETDEMLARFTSETADQTTSAIRNMIIAAILFGVAGSILMLLAIKSNLRPLSSLVRSMESLVGGEFDFPLPSVKHSDEVGKLTQSVAAMKRRFKDYLRQLTETTAAKERMESEIKIARNIQMSIIPRAFPPFPERPEIDVHAFLKAAKEVGGDYYDFFFLDDETLLVTVGDVSDKGVPASLYMAVVRTLIRAKVVHGLTPAQVMTRLNQDLSRNNESMMFLSAFLGLLNVRSGALQYCNAGCELPLIVRAEGGVKKLGVPDGVVVGIKEDYEYKTNEFNLYPGDLIITFTDGIVKTINKENEIFGRARIEDALTDAGGIPPADAISKILNKIEEFSAGAEQIDDLTLLAVRFNGGPEQL